MTISFVLAVIFLEEGALAELKSHNYRLSLSLILSVMVSTENLLVNDRFLLNSCV